MSGNDDWQVNRRDFLQTGAMATASAVTLASGSTVAAPPASKKTLPRRPLGKTGVDVTILNLGTWKSPGLDRLLRFAYANGVRYYDAAKSYGSEPAIARWFQAMPEVRKEIFLVTKDHPNTPRQLIKQLDERLAALQTDYVDLLFLHGIGPGGYGEASLEWPKSKEFKETIEAIKKSGKAKFVGFSCHDPKRAEYLQAAAEGGFVDAIMVQYTAWNHTPEMNRALDACHERGIGLISMKQVAGQTDRILDEVPRRVPSLKEKGLTAYQGLLHAIWTDERIASSCVSMRNTDQIRENCLAAATFEPLKQAEMDGLRDACLAAGPDLLRRLRRALRAGGEHIGRAGRPDPPADLPRPVRLPRRGAPALRRAPRTRPQLAGSRPRGRPPGVPESPRFRQPPPQGRPGPGLIVLLESHRRTARDLPGRAR